MRTNQCNQLNKKTGYCLCTPSLAVDAVIEVAAGGDGAAPSFILVKRRVPPADVYVVPGGFVEVEQPPQLSQTKIRFSL
jgi:ADP-ribose pyrophosphatase YjhB (NUDIX family)